MIVVIDNYDSFTYNVVQYLGEMQQDVKVVRNDAVSVEDVKKMTPDAIVVSPGPCTPKDAGISVELIRRLHGIIPILGVCLGHQAIGEAFGGSVIKAPSVVHGKVSSVFHNGKGIFRDIPAGFSAARYHSLVISRENFPKELEIVAHTEEGIIMAVQHKSAPVFGVQFHPESIATEYGKILLRNFIDQRYKANP